MTDQAIRRLATDPGRSFIVQAPAGSGKTEILTQRYLRLLETVKAPEQIIALTFTRKAASEMRTRILSALKNAHSGQPTTAHAQLTQDYARKALARCQQNNWQLLQQPSRLKIMTIDSLCQLLSQAIPIQDKQVPYAKVAVNPKPLYRRAVNSFISYLFEQPQYHPELETLLYHLDNRQDLLCSLLEQLLANREQWLHPLYHSKTCTKERYDTSLRALVDHELKRFKNTISQHYLDELQDLCRQVACHENKPESPRYVFCQWDTLFSAEIARALASFLLTKEGKLRKAFDHHVGFKRDDWQKAQYDDIKQRSKALLEQLNEPCFLQALLRLTYLPPMTYDNSQWEVLQALLSLLPLLIAHLQLTFLTTNTLDFNAIAAHALQALGDDEAPTDLALYLDNTIHHLLIDEFQDTSQQQFQLLTKLVQTWLPEEKKTLFIVGDPMQSIYRFRQADVSLFLQAQRQGIGEIALSPLTLTQNFRSSQLLIDWVNQHFQSIFPRNEDIDAGAIAFHRAESTQRVEADHGIFAHALANKMLEAQAIVHLTATLLETYPNEDIAILVRSRQQLEYLTPLFRKQAIPYQGIEIEKLAKLPHLMDCWSLTQALLMPANRLAWLAWLRSPWCGLSLLDLHSIANFDKTQSIYYALKHLDRISNVSEEGRGRAQFVFNKMHSLLLYRHQTPFIESLIQLLHELHLYALLTPEEVADLEQFFVLTSQHLQQGQITDFVQFEKDFKTLYSQRIKPARVHIMTIHKSKGLEFDTVILPGLGSKSAPADNPLLRFLKLPNKLGNEPLLAPLPSKKQACAIYHYIAKSNTEREMYEQQRLLYVAVTRAKKRLYLYDCQEKISSNSFRELLQAQSFTWAETENISDDLPQEMPFALKRLPFSFYSSNEPNHPNLEPALSLSSLSLAKHIGSLAHELLQWLCDHHPEDLSHLPWSMLKNRFIALGFDRLEQELALTELHQQITGLWANPVGRWLCQKHEHEHNEYELLSLENGELTTRIIDRTFYDKGCYWVIDFKTGKDDESAQTMHRQQVNHYARLLTNMGKHPVRCGLYYLSHQSWVHWNYEESTNPVEPLQEVNSF